MERPMDSKPIGSIMIDVYEGNRTFCSFKGNIPAEVLMGVRVTLPRDFHNYLNARSEQDTQRMAEVKRVEKAKQAEEDRRNIAVKQEKERVALKLAQEIEAAESELRSIKATVITEFTQVELRKHDQVLEEAEKKLAKLKS